MQNPTITAPQIDKDRAEIARQLGSITPRGYQVDLALAGAEILRLYGIAFYAMEMRTGKTLTSMFAVSCFPNFRRVCVVTKVKAIKSIQADYDAANFGFELVISSFDSLHKLTERFDVVIIDESQNIAAFPKPSKRARECKRLFNKIPIIYQTGTPTPETFAQIYHQLWISFRSPFSEWTTFYKWANDFVKKYTMKLAGHDTTKYDRTHEGKIMQYVRKYFITLTQKQAGFKSAGVEEVFLEVELKSPFFPFLWRKLSKDLVVDIARGTHPEIKVQFDTGNASIFDRLRPVDAMKDDDEVLTIMSDTPAKKLSKLHQLCGGSVKPEHFEHEGDAAPKTIIFDTTKAEFIRDKFAGKKIAVFYKFQAELDILKRTFKNWTTSPEDFELFDDLTFLGQCTSVREGVKLSTAEALVAYAIDFSATTYFQLTNRAQTKDNKTPAKFYWIFTKGGIERDVYEAVSNKKKFTSAYYNQILNKRNNGKL